MAHENPAVFRFPRVRGLSGFTVAAAVGGLIGLAACGAQAPAECSTDSTWQGGDEESPLMHPGGDCIGCHAQGGEGPKFSIAGTVMAGSADDTDCNGTAGVTVEITGADGQVLELATNSAGNFYSTKTVATPYSAKIKKGGAERAMSAAQTETNCASCHTADGANGAPGRVLAP